MGLLSVPVSIGELIDKITILRIKMEKITDPEKQKNINKELSLLEDLCRNNSIDLKLNFVNELLAVNQKLWQVEDDIRDEEFKKQFGSRFVDLARQVYRLNDERFKVKRQINQHYNSELKEEKSYREF